VREHQAGNGSGNCGLRMATMILKVLGGGEEDYFREPRNGGREVEGTKGMRIKKLSLSCGIDRGAGGTDLRGSPC